MEMKHKALRKIPPTQGIDFNTTAADPPFESKVEKQSHSLGLDIGRDNYKDFAPIETVIEVYHCAFCKFEDDMRSRMENHYYFRHITQLMRIQGSSLGRKIDLLITNGDKTSVKSFVF